MVDRVPTFEIPLCRGGLPVYYRHGSWNNGSRGRDAPVQGTTLTTPRHSCAGSVTRNMHARSTWMNILTKNAVMCLAWNIHGLAHGHWSNARGKIDGVSGVLEEAGNEFWGYTSREGPFESDGEDFRKWVDYVNAKKAVVMEKISDVQDRLLEVQEETDSLHKDDNRKGPASQAKGTAFGSSSSLVRTSLTLKQYLQALKNWATYLEEVKTSWDGGIPVEEIQGVMEQLETQKETVDRGELLRISLLLRNLRKSVKTRKDDPDTTCNETDSKTGDVLRQVQKNFSETFLYKNITLAEINQMSRIVDFVDRYRGRVERIPGPGDGRNARESEIAFGEEVEARRGN